ncbi:unnamed protein product [Phytophthora fragariaefolia]|uniref:Unnamed protein product n=1 Tax=Phytophthora fragariaefolia TaxID=1490495 RepID=A0A9W6WV99_9STRA|nr:unnamed protein product [Phytophthora fragariaefolia]
MHASSLSSSCSFRDFPYHIYVVSPKANMTQTRRHILVVGSVGADIVVEVDQMPARGETRSARKHDTGNVYPGGKGDNQAAAVAKLIGADHPTLVAKMACQFGNDSHGEMIKKTLQSVGAAAEANVPLMWDAGGDDYPIPTDVLPLLTFLCPNETELARLTKREVNNTEDAIAAARLLQDQGAKDVLVTLGVDGSVFVPADGTKVLRQSSFKVDNVVDTTGAGDCYRGAFAVAFAECRSLQDCMVRASAASALCVQRVGALPSLPSGDEVVAFLKSQGF